MKRRIAPAPALALATALIASPVWAGWSVPSGVQGTPVDVTVAGEGRLVVASGVATQEFTGTTAGREIRIPSASGFIDAQGCLAAFDLSGMLRGDQSSAECSYAIPIGLGNTVKRIRVGPTGAAYGCSWEISSSRFVYSPNATSAAWTSLNLPSGGVCDLPLSVLEVGSEDVALFGLNLTTNNTQLYRNGALLPAAGTPGTTSRPRSVQLVETSDARVRALVVDAQGRLYTSTVSDAGLDGYELLPMPEGITGFQSVAFHLGTTGERFGTAVAQRNDGTYVVLSAVPHPDEAMAGRLWRENPHALTMPGAQPLGPGSQVQCLEAVGCGVITSGSGDGSVLSYANASAPGVASAAPSTVAAGGSVTVPVSVDDPDGDAVWVDWVQVSPNVPQLEVVIDDGGLAATITAPSFCSGDFEAIFQLVAMDGRTGHVSGDGIATVTVTGRAPAVGELVGSALEAQCGGPAFGELDQKPAQNACATQAIRWERIAGPELESDVLDGTRVVVRTRATGWDGLIGEQLTLRATASAGDHVSAPATMTLPIRPGQRFVQARYRTDTPIATEEVPLLLSVELENTSQCGVSGATWTEQLDGLRYVEGSARLDGERIDGQVEDGRLLIEGIALEGRARRTLSYSVRPTVLGRSTPSGQLAVKGEPISPLVGLGGTSVPGGCGCASTPTSAWLPAVLGLLVAITTRRRSVAASARRGALRAAR